MRKVNKIKLICVGCQKEFEVLPCYINRKFCSAKCAHTIGNSGNNWHGGVRRGKGSRPNEPQSAIDARAKAKVEKHVDEFLSKINIDKLYEIINLNYCNSITIILKYVLKDGVKINRSKIFINVLKKLNLYDKFNNTPDYSHSIKKASPKDWLWFLSLLKECNSYNEFSIRFTLENNGKLGRRALSYSVIQPILINEKIDTFIYDKYGNKLYSNNYGTLPEVQIRSILNDLSLNFLEQVKFKHFNASINKYSYYRADFVVDERLIIEVNGDYWHGWDDGKISNEWKKERQNTDKKKYEFYEKSGFSYLVIWEHELKENDVNIIKDKIIIGVLNARNNQKII